MGVSKEAQNARGREVFKMTADGQRRKKERKGGWGLKDHCQCGCSSTATGLTPVLVFGVQCLPAQLQTSHPLPVHSGQISEWVFVFLPVTFPAAVPQGAAIPALLPLADWHSCCALQVFPAKAMEIWLLPSVRAGGGPAGCKLWPKS